MFIPGLVTGRMFDMGIFKIPFAVASAWLVAATFLVAECKEYWQFLLCQGLVTGVNKWLLIKRTYEGTER